MDASGPPPGHVRVARIGRSHGLNGAVRVQVEVPFGVDALQASDTVWVEGLGDVEVLHFGPHGHDFLLELGRVRRVETAKRLVHAAVFVPDAVIEAVRRESDERPDDPADPQRWIGLPVRFESRDLGSVEAIEGSPLQPLLRIRGASGDLLLPATAPYVRRSRDVIDLVDPPDGLLDPS